MRTITVARVAAACSTLLAIGAGAAAAQTRQVLGADSSTWIGASGQWRMRGESWTGYAAGAPAGAVHDDAFALSRFRLKGELHVRGLLAVVAEGKSSLATDRTLPGGTRVSDEDVIDVQQLFAEARVTATGAATSLRAGRFELALGRERLISPLDWTNSGRTFQGARAGLTRGANAFQAFWVRPVIMRQRQADGPDSTRQLYGAEFARVFPSRTRFEAYWLRNESFTATVNGTTGAERRHTIGMRVNRQPASGRPDADVEMAWQTGSLGGAPVRAWMVGSQAGWTLAGSLGARVYAGFDAASGDKANGGSVQTFNQLYPLGHAYLGYADVHGRQNILDWSAGVSVKPARNTTIQLDGHEFHRASTADALYAVDGSVTRAAGTGLAARVGAELDATVRRTMAAGRLTLQLGASRYFAGPFLRQTGPARDITFAYGQATASF
ncbi:MAG: alginate export family protein [Gemmatimonadales bacterium]